MKQPKSAYQRVRLDGRWYVIVAEDEFRALAQARQSGTKSDPLDALTDSDQRLADRLLQRRRESGLTQKALARLADIRVETLNRIEKGRTTPDFKTIRKLVNAMNERGK
jgi:DNA-binding XRE family transcriptional regulator